MRTCWFIVLESLGQWWVDCEGKAYGPFADREQASDEARAIAKAFGDPTRTSRVYVPTDGGAHRLIWSGQAAGASTAAAA
ncbi:hypothetical protein [Devosia sp.]|uniref:hypothetical protein n=1 Tax=Devosia sp. TaxID=1871048 RepID=UPI003A926973